MVRFLALPLLVAVAAPALAGDVSVRLDSGAGLSVKDATGAVERLRVDEATGNVSRNGALFVHTTGTDSTFVGAGAGNLSITGFGRNTAFGSAALRVNSTGSQNSAFGEAALWSNTSGYANSAFGRLALAYNTTGGENTAFGAQALIDNTTGGRNAAFGYKAMHSNQTGLFNTAVGNGALYSSRGSGNTGVGSGAVGNNQTGGHNSALGAFALGVFDGSDNAALGYSALTSLLTGSDNTAVGSQALVLATSGNRNVAIGRGAGDQQTTGSNNIYIANGGVAAENGQIRIGAVGTHTATTIAGISGATSAGGIAVLVNASGVLGTTTSSARFKQDVRDMSDAGDLLMRLRPVTFRYREDAVGADESKTTQYGLIAEEVAEVAPELVAPDLDGKPYSVKYHELPALLLAQNQEQQRTIDELKARIARLEAERRTGAK